MTQALSPAEKRARAESRISKRNEAALDQSGANDPKVLKPQSAGAKVTIACKVDLPWIDLRICEEAEVSENTQTGPRTIKIFRPTGPVVRIRGTALPVGIAPKGFPKPPELIAGAALTPGVDKSFWDLWVHQHRMDAIVVNGLIFANENRDHVVGQAHEMEGIKSGLGGLDVENHDPRINRSSRKDVEGVDDDSRNREGGRHHVS